MTKAGADHTLSCEDTPVIKNTKACSVIVNFKFLHLLLLGDCTGFGTVQSLQSSLKMALLNTFLISLADIYIILWPFEGSVLANDVLEIFSRTYMKTVSR